MIRPGFLRGFWKLSWVETKIFAREPMGFIGTLVVPVVIFIVLGRIFGATRPRATPRLDIPFNPAIFAAVIIAIGAVQSLVAIMAIYREGGILKRLRATPLSPVHGRRRSPASMVAGAGGTNHGTGFYTTRERRSWIRFARATVRPWTSAPFDANATTGCSTSPSRCRSWAACSPTWPSSTRSTASPTRLSPWDASAWPSSGPSS